MTRKLMLGAITFLLAIGIAQASWYDDYDAGVNAARKGQWSTVVQKMTAAIGSHDKESDNERTYGAIFISYHPRYYRAVAYLNLGKYDQAVADLETARGAGELDLGSIDSLMRRAKAKLEAANSVPTETAAPPPTQTVAPPRPVPVNPTPAPVPAAPTIDPALRQRAMASIAQAKQHLGSAQQRKAGSAPQYGQAVQSIADANTRLAGAKTNDDVNAAITLADNASLFADAAQPPGAPPVAVAPRPVVAQTRPAVATDIVLEDSKRRVRVALESYFRGDFDQATSGFVALTKELPNNGWLWAFLGASQYSQYAFEGEDSYKASAMQAFHKAKQYKGFKDGLPSRYFSKKIRKAFDAAS